MRMIAPLFDEGSQHAYPREYLGPGTAILGGFALQYEASLLSALSSIAEQSPFRHMTTPGGFRMSVAMTNCGAFGWVTDRKGYRYDSIDPDTGLRWPSMPASFVELARRSASEAGFPGFAPDGCLINRYDPGAKLSLHQDKDELDFTAPIVSASLGLPAVFLFGGNRRSDQTVRIPVIHGDVLVWGGLARQHYHGLLQLKNGVHPLFGGHRYNLTFRKAR
jgi:alkylated DNA repair protein (DNA oxidative demethylase)